MSDRGRDVSMALTEARTVLSRAETALRSGYLESDPDGASMRADLEYVVQTLKRWRRTGAPAKRDCPTCGKRVTVSHAASGKLDRHYTFINEEYGICPGR